MKTKRNNRFKKRTSKRSRYRRFGGNLDIKYPKIDASVKDWVILNIASNDYHLVLFPLDKIPAKSWAQIRYDANCKLLEERKTTRPIILGLSMKDEIMIVDGNHRSVCAKEKGYTHIPAIVEPSLYKKMKLDIIDMDI